MFQSSVSSAPGAGWELAAGGQPGGGGRSPVSWALLLFLRPSGSATALLSVPTHPAFLPHTHTGWWSVLILWEV